MKARYELDLECSCAWPTDEPLPRWAMGFVAFWTGVLFVGMVAYLTWFCLHARRTEPIEVDSIQVANKVEKPIRLDASEMRNYLQNKLDEFDAQLDAQLEYGGYSQNKVARAKRWVLEFEYATGEDLWDQWAKIQAIIAVPEATPRLRVFRDLEVKPPKGKIESLADVEKTGMAWVIDRKANSVRALANYLGLETIPGSIVFYIPRQLERDLWRSERLFRNKSERELVGTVTRFRVSVHADGQRLTVVSQTSPP